jgi:hypothetical protein
MNFAWPPSSPDTPDPVAKLRTGFLVTRTMVILMTTGISSVLPACDGPLIATVGLVSTLDAATPDAASDAAGDAGGDLDALAPDTGLPSGDTVRIVSGSREQFCMGRGPAVRVVAAASAAGSLPTCNAGIARRLFSYGLCSCSDALLSGSFSIDSFDSRRGAYVAGPPLTGGAVGTNGSPRLDASLFDLGGTVISAGTGSLLIPGTGAFGGDLKTNAALDITGTLLITFARDVWARDGIRTSSSVSVARDLYQAPGHSIPELVEVAGRMHMTDFVVSPPCPCGADAVLDVAAVVAAAQVENDNGALGLSADALSARLSTGVVPAELTCGRFVLAAASLPSGTLAAIAGRIALFVNGDLTIAGNFATELGSAGELDVFVTGNLVLSGPLGDPNKPTALRFYVGGNQPIHLAGLLVPYAVQLYAPNAPVLLDDAAQAVHGSIFSASFETLSTLQTIHYDRAILDLGEECNGLPTPPCSDCRQCPAGLSCVDGACRACRSDADCCEPMACTDGICQPLLVPAL